MKSVKVLPILLLTISALRAETAVPPAEIVNRYVTALQSEDAQPQNLKMDVDIDASLPRLKKSGRLQAIRFITKLGKIFYQRPRFEGDETVKKEVIARYLTAEKEARGGAMGASMAVTPENYKFKYRGPGDYVGRPAYVFELSPRKKRLGLYKGELWIDAQTFLPLRQWGVLVKSPSIFLKSVYFVRDFWIIENHAIPRRVITNIDTRLVGQAKITIWFDHFSVTDQNPENASAAAPQHGGE